MGSKRIFTNITEIFIIPPMFPISYIYFSLLLYFPHLIPHLSWFVYHFLISISLSPILPCNDISPLRSFISHSILLSSPIPSISSFPSLSFHNSPFFSNYERREKKKKTWKE